MSTFKTIERLGLKIWDYKDPHHHFAVDAEELERLLQSAQVVYGANGLPGDGVIWQDEQHNVDTYSALLIGITPLKKKTQAEAALEFIQRVADREYTSWSRGSVADEAKRILEMKD